MKNKIKFIYFDMGGVVIVDFSKNNKWKEMLEGLGIPGPQQEQFTESFKLYVDDLCTGKKDSSEVFDIARNEIGFDAPEGYDMLKDFVNRFEVSPSMHPFVQSVSEKYKVGLLTNMYPGMLDAIKERELLPKVNWDVVLDSSLLGLVKPQEELFAMAEKEAGVPSENILFIENTTEHIVVAQKRGWQTFLYDPADVQNSKKDLELILL